MKKIKTAVKTFAQHLFITMEFFGKNSMANHAAAGAYGFLLSAAPMLLILSFFLFLTFRSTPEAVMVILHNIPFLNLIIDEDMEAVIFQLVSAPSGVPVLVSIFSIMWAGRIFALSLYRGLKTIFTGKKKRNPVQDNLAILTTEFIMLIVMLIIILCSRAALHLYEAAGVIVLTPFFSFLAALLGSQSFRLAMVVFALFCAYRLIPANPPRQLSALLGSVLGAATYGTAAMLLSAMLNKSKYNFLYGAMGELIILLVNVYFFFFFFFMWAQFASVHDSFEALLFSRLRAARIKAAEKSNAESPPAGRLPRPDVTRMLFYSVDGKLKKYCRHYRKGETVMSRGEEGDEAFFLLEGEVEVLTRSSAGTDSPIGVLHPGSFFGEMSHLLSENRSATVRAKTDISALALPPVLFDAVLDYDTDLDRSIIEHLSRRLKNDNDKIASLTGSGEKPPHSAAVNLR